MLEKLTKNFGAFDNLDLNQDYQNVLADLTTKLDIVSKAAFKSLTPNISTEFKIDFFTNVILPQLEGDIGQFKRIDLAFLKKLEHCFENEDVDKSGFLDFKLAERLLNRQFADVYDFSSWKLSSLNETDSLDFNLKKYKQE